MVQADEKRHWDSYWEEESNRAFWFEPDKTVVALVNGLDKSKTGDALDLGCGIGRHTRLLAEAGFRVIAVDMSQSALAAIREHLGKDADIRLILGDYTEDLFGAGSFDLVLAWNVLYHGAREQFKKAIGLVHKWLRPGGQFFFTCPTRRDAKYGNGEEVAPHTYRPLNSIHPGDIHYFANESDLSEFLSGFILISRTASEHVWDNQETAQFSSYWRVLAQKGRS
jgi:SAM-dependent methyltransferase